MAITPENSEQIISATGVPSASPNAEQLCADLNETFNHFSIWKELDNQQTRKQRLNQLSTIVKRAKTLLALVDPKGGTGSESEDPLLFDTLVRHAERYAEEHGPYPGLEPIEWALEDGDKITTHQSATAVERAIAGIRWLETWADAAQQELKSNPDLYWREMSGPAAESWLIGKQLPLLFERHFDKPFGVSKASHDPTGKKGHKPYGPGIRFIQAVFKTMDIEKSADAIEKTWDRHRKSQGDS